MITTIGFSCTKCVLLYYQSPLRTIRFIEGQLRDHMGCSWFRTGSDRRRLLMTPPPPSLALPFFTSS